ncbi:MAG: DNA polymerase Y family protein [Rhodocyclaceae bacterium]
MLWLALYLPNLPLQVFQRAAPDTQALAVAESRAGARRIVAANGAAQRCGVHAGLGVASALALVPELAVRPRNPRAESEALQEIAAWALQFTPGVSLDAPACVLLEIAASLRLFGGMEALLQRIGQGSRELGYTVETAAAPTPRAARWLARAGHPVLIRDPESLPSALAPLPLDMLDAEPATVEMLFSVGAVTVADCLQLPRAGLARRGAATLTQSLDQALGRQPDPRAWFVAPDAYAARIPFPASTEHAEALLFGARRLFAGLAAYLAAHHAGIERFRLHLEHEEGGPTPLTITLGGTSRDEARFNLLTREHLARLTLPCPVEALSLVATEIRPLPGTSGTLFGNDHQTAEAQQLLVERLRARLGFEAIGGLRPVADHRPERAWRAAEPGDRKPLPLPAQARPLWLLPHPQRLEMRNAQPCWHCPLELLSGPERIESGWWDDAEALRDYFVAKASDSALVWVFRELTPPYDWYAQGIFA